jgi:hypothetical protein
MSHVHGLFLKELIQELSDLEASIQELNFSPSCLMFSGHDLTGADPGPRPPGPWPGARRRWGRLRTGTLY